MRNFFYIVFASAFLSINALQAQTAKEQENLTRILFVFDGSQSMFGRWESGSKIDVAQRLMNKMLDSLQSLDSRNFQLALRVYGHQKPVPPQDCNDTKLEVPFKYNNIPSIKKVIRGINPKGTTPIARSLLRATSDFPDCPNCRNIIILITDGVEACDEDPCAASLLLQKKGIALKPFVIGIGLDKEFQKTFECVGTYFDATNEKTFQNVLGIVISQALDNTTAQINLLDQNDNPSETNIPITFYDQVSGQVKKQIVHTLNFKGNPDTIYLDPLITYKMTVHSVPERSVENIKISAGQHNQIGVKMPRGKLDFKMGSGRVSYENLQCIIREHNGKEILHVQDFTKIQAYISGFYDIEILTLPRYTQENLNIEAGKTTSIGIPPPGKVNISSSSVGHGAILLEDGDKQIWVIDLEQSKTTHSMYLQPGTYKVVFRSKSSRKSEYSTAQSFSITSGTTTIVKLK